MLRFTLYGPQERAPDEVNLTEFEFYRKRNIENNQARLECLGVPEAVKDLAALFQADPCSPKRRPTSGATVVAPVRDYNLRDRTQPTLKPQRRKPAPVRKQSRRVSTGGSNCSDEASMSDEVRSYGGSRFTMRYVSSAPFLHQC